MTKLNYVQTLRFLDDQMVLKFPNQTFNIPFLGNFNSLAEAEKTALLSFYRRIDDLNRQLIRGMQVSQEFEY